jgi:Mg-chelatase subunit ChlD
VRPSDRQRCPCQKISKLNVGIVGGSTDLAAGLLLAARFSELAVVVVVTDGASNDNNAALDSAASLKRRGTEIICIGTDDADNSFLALLATRSDLASYVSSHNLRSAITEASRLLR